MNMTQKSIIKLFFIILECMLIALCILYLVDQYKYRYFDCKINIIEFNISHCKSNDCSYDYCFKALYNDANNTIFLKQNCKDEPEKKLCFKNFNVASNIIQRFNNKNATCYANYIFGKKIYVNNLSIHNQKKCKSKGAALIFVVFLFISIILGFLYYVYISGYFTIDDIYEYNCNDDEIEQDDSEDSADKHNNVIQTHFQTSV